MAIPPKYGSDPYSPGSNQRPDYPDVGNRMTDSRNELPEMLPDAVNALVQEYVDQKMQLYPAPEPATVSVPGSEPGAPDEVMTIPSPKEEIEEGYFEEGQLIAQLAIRVARIMFATHLVRFHRYDGTNRYEEDFHNLKDLVGNAYF